MENSLESELEGPKDMSELSGDEQEKFLRSGSTHRCVGPTTMHLKPPFLSHHYSFHGTVEFCWPKLFRDEIVKTYEGKEYCSDFI